MLLLPICILISFQAVKAGFNAMKQMKVALRSRDPFVLYKCWLFVAMSLMQQGKLKRSRGIIQQVHDQVKDKDATLSCMCKGIWARLKYVWNREIKASQ